MKTNTWISLVLTLMVNAVVFGIGAIAILSIPSLYDKVKYLLPAWIVLTLIVSPFIARALALRLRSRMAPPNERA